jgi:hypothetical protein
MSETILKILLSELATLRITCRACKATVEVPIDSLNRGRKSIICPGCGVPMRSVSHHQPDAFDALADAVQGLKKLQDCDAAFVLPVPPTN